MLTAAFEILLLSGFQRNALTRSGMQAVKNRVHREAWGMSKDLAFRMLISQ